MKTRFYAVVGAVALVVSIGSASAFACGAGHHSAHNASATKVSYAAPATSVKQPTTR